MPLDLPSVQSLNDMQFLPTGLNLMAGQNMGLQQQYSQGMLQEQAANLQAQSLKNMFNEQNNPQLLQAQSLANIGSGNANTISGVNADLATGTKDEAMAAKKQKFLAEADEDTLKSLAAQGEALSVKGAGLGDADMEAKGKRMIEASAKALAAKASQAATQENTRVIVGGRKDVAETNAGAKLSVEQQRGVTAAAIQGMKNEVAIQKLQQAAASGIDPNKLLGQAIVDARNETDPAKHDAAMEYVNGLNNMIIGQKQALSGQQINVAEAANMPKNVIPPVAIPAGPARPQALPAGAQSPVSMPVARGPNGPIQQPNKEGVVDTLLREYQKPQTSEADYQGLERELRAAGYRGQLPMKGKVAVPGATPNIPAGAAQMLKGNPALAAAFDQKYGPGASKAILGQ